MFLMMLLLMPLITLSPFTMYPKTYRFNHVKPLHLIRLRGGNQHAKHPPKSVEDETMTINVNSGVMRLTTHFKPSQNVVFFGSKYDAKKSSQEKSLPSNFPVFVVGVLGAVYIHLLQLPQMLAAYVFLGGGNSNIFGIFTPNLGEMISILTHIFQMGWFNHQLVVFFVGSFNKIPGKNIGGFQLQVFCRRANLSSSGTLGVRKFPAGVGRGWKLPCNLWKHGGTSQLGGFCISFSIQMYTCIYIYVQYIHVIYRLKTRFFQGNFFFSSKSRRHLHPFFGSATKNRRWVPSRRRIWPRGCWSASLRWAPEGGRC